MTIIKNDTIYLKHDKNQLKKTIYFDSCNFKKLLKLAKKYHVSNSYIINKLIEKF